MSRRLSFSIAVNLLTENFKKGTNTVKNALRSMQMQVLTFAAALGAGGLGISGLLSKFRDVARETSRVITALKNVSDGTKGFSDNLRFVNDLAKKYGLEITALTGNFAKFTASATQANMPMEQQKKVFESVSRAIMAFGLSASESDGVMLALSQMMGKGKISMEELRKQMGEKLPVAIQAMAKALGVSIGQMEKLIGSGKVMSADVLPKFADALNEIIPNVDTDNLETSLSRLSNAFGDIVDASGFQNKYKAAIDGLTSLLESASKNIQNIIVGIVAAIGFVVTNGLSKVYRSYARNGQMIVANANTTHNKLRAAIAARVEAEIALEKAKEAQIIAPQRQQLQTAKEVEKAKQTLSARTAQVNVAHENAKAAAAQAAAIKSKGAWGTAGIAIAGTFKKLGTALKSMWSSFAPAIIISAIIAIIGSLKNLYDEGKRVKNIFSDFKKEAANISNTQEIKVLQMQLRLMNSKKSTQVEINAAQKALQKMLGNEKLSQKEINKEVAKRIQLLKSAAEADFYAQENVRTGNEINKLAYQSGVSKEQIITFARLLKNGDHEYQDIFNLAYRASGGSNSKARTAMESAQFIADELLEIYEYTDAQLKKAINDSNKIIGKTPTGGEPDDKANKNAKRLADELLELKYKNAQAGLDLMDENEERRLAQIELNYNKEIDLIKKKEKEWTSAQSGTLTADQLSTLSASYELAEQNKLKSIVKGDQEALANALKSNVEYLKEYGSFQQKKFAIADEYAKKIREAEKEGNNFEVARLKKQQQIDTSAVEVAAIKAEIDWQSVFSNFGLILKDQVISTLDNLKKYAKSDEFQIISVEDKKLIYDAINKLEYQLSGGLNKKMFIDVANALQNYKDSSQRLIKAREKETKAANDLSKANEKLKNALLRNNKEEIAPAQKEAATAKFIFDQAAESVLSLTDENNSFAETLKSSSTKLSAALDNLEDGLSKLSSGSLKTILGGVVEISKVIGGKVGNSIAEEFDKGGLLGKLISAILGILDLLKEGIGTLVSGIIDTVLNAVDGILKNILSGNMFKQVGVSLFTGVRNILDTVTFGVFGSHGNTKEVNELVNKLTISNRYLVTAIDRLTDEMLKSGGAKSSKYYQDAYDKQDQKIENDRLMLEAKMRYSGSHHSNNYYINKAFKEQDWEKASKHVGKKLNGAGDLWKLSPEDLAKLQELPDIWDKLNKGKYNQSDWLQEYINDANTLVELTEKWQDAITDTSFDNIRSEMKNLLSDFTVTSEDAIASVDEFMKNAILNSIISGTYSDFIENWQSEFANAMKDGILSDDEANSLRKRYQEIFDKAITDRDAAYEAAGIKDSELKKQQNSSKGYSTAMNQETGGAILGTVTGINESILTCISLVRGAITDTSKSLTYAVGISDELKKHTGIFYEIQQMQVKSFRQGEKISEGISSLLDIKDDLACINKNTKYLSPRN